MEKHRTIEQKQMPEKTPEEEDDDDCREVKIQNGMSITLDDDIFEVRDTMVTRPTIMQQDTACELMNQIFALEAVETATKMQATQRSKDRVPLEKGKVPKRQKRISLEEKKGAERKEALLEVI